MKTFSSFLKKSSLEKFCFLKKLYEEINLGMRY